MFDDALIGIEWEPQLTLLDFPNQEISVIRKLNLDMRGYLKTSKILSSVGNSNLMVYNLQLSGCSHSSIFISIDDSYTPSYYDGCSLPRYLGVDDSMNNTEIRTRPVKLELLKDHSDFCTEYLGHFVEDLSLLTKGVGVFLPVKVDEKGLPQMHSSPNKHINISFPEPPGYLLRFKENNYNLWHWFSEQAMLLEYFKLKNFRTHTTSKPSDIDTGQCRLHIMVPYNFTDYNKLVEKAYKVWGANRDYSLKGSMIDLAKYLDFWYSMNVQNGPVLVCHTNGKKVKIVNPLF